MKIKIGKYDSAARVVPVTFTEGELIHERSVNACHADDGSYDAAATKDRVADVARGVAVKMGLGLLEKAPVVVVRVAAGADAAATSANVIGATANGLKTGMQALLGAESQLGVKPRILGAPGLDTASRRSSATAVRKNGIWKASWATAPGARLRSTRSASSPASSARWRASFQRSRSSRRVRCTGIVPEQQNPRPCVRMIKCK